MTYNNYAAAGSMAKGPQPNGPKLMTTMKDFIILTKIGKWFVNQRGLSDSIAHR